MGDHTRLNAARYLSRRRFIGRCASAALGLAVAGCVAGREPLGNPGPRLITTLGDLALPDTGVILPHEHIFLDIARQQFDPQQERVQVEDVVEVMQPELENARAAGVAVLVDAGSPSLGRRADIVVAVSRAARLPVVVPTGFYLDPSIPEWARAASEEELRDWMVGELVGGMEATHVKAGWIKLAASDGGLTEQERKCLRAAARAGAATDSTIGCHIASGIVARDALDTVERSGYRAERFVWIHADLEPWIHADGERDSGLREELARRGAWVEFDKIGFTLPGGDAAPIDMMHIDMIQHMLDAGFGDRLLLSMDSGWYDPGRPDCRAGCIKGYTYLSKTFLPKLRKAGVDESTIDKLTRENPFHAFARPS
jgi:phosphotriesterase-related protein